MYQIVRLQKDLSQPGFSDRIVLQVEFVEPMERVLVCMHVEGIDRKVVCGKTQRSEHFSEGEVFPISEDDNILSHGEAGGIDSREKTNIGGALHF